MKQRLLLDALMSILLVLQMLYLVLSDLWHEVAGCLLLVLFILHHVANRRWYKALRKGKYNRLRFAIATVDMLSRLSIVVLAISGVMLSQHVFVFLGIRRGLDGARIAHLLASYWGFFFISLHAGMHMAGILRKRVLRTVLTIVSVYGLISFIKERLFSYMFLQTLFVISDFDISAAVYVLRYSPIMVLYMRLGAVLSLLLRKQDKYYG